MYVSVIYRNPGAGCMNVWDRYCLGSFCIMSRSYNVGLMSMINNYDVLGTSRAIDHQEAMEGKR